MDELRLGKVSNADLASWFLVEETTLSRRKKKYLEKLKNYCDFAPYRGGVEITKIYKSFYIQNQSYKIVQEHFSEYWNSSGLDTCSHVGTQIYEDYQDQLTVKESTTIKHTVQVRDEKYNKPFSEKNGTEGKCSYILCKKNDKGQPVFLTYGEEEIKKDLLVKYFGSAEEKTVMIQQMIKNGEITNEEAWERYSEMMNLPRCYPAFMSEFKKLTGVQLIKGTLLDRTLSAF